MPTESDDTTNLSERSDGVSSPTGRHHAYLASHTGPAGSLTQAMVDHSWGGAGLGAFPAARAPVALVWRSDLELVVRYPADLPPIHIDAANSSFGLGGRGRVIYEAVPRETLPEPTWHATHSFRVRAHEHLERGELSSFEDELGIHYQYSYYDGDEPDASTEALLARGLQGGGESWAGIVLGLVALRAPELADHLEIDPEADGLRVHADARTPLDAVAALVAEAKRDPALLEAAIARATADGVME
ncbi:MAG: Imm51 family immunity protein [Myxococcota bacterium]